MTFDLYAPIFEQTPDLGTAQPVSEAVVSRYAGLLPDGFLGIWRRYGNRLLIGEGRIQLCDPAPAQAALAPWFTGDPELSIDRMVPVAYTSLGSILLLDGSLTAHDLDLELRRLTRFPMLRDAEALTDVDTWVAQRLRADMTFVRHDRSDVDYHARAVRKHGPLQPGEVFGWEPPFDLSDVAPMKPRPPLRKFTLADRIARLQSLFPLEYHRSFANIFEAVPYGGQTFIRQVVS
jgi:hypothetical protein